MDRGLRRRATWKARRVGRGHVFRRESWPSAVCSYDGKMTLIRLPLSWAGAQPLAPRSLSLARH